MLRWLGLAMVLWMCAQSHSPNAAEAVSAAAKIRVLVVSGGHDFETNAFYQVFKDNHQITFESVSHPKAHDWFKPEAAAKYDVVVLYDMWQNITDEAKTNFVHLLKSGKGLVAMHHCLGSYQAWDEYAKIIGGKYHFNPYSLNGVQQPASTYKHDVDFKVQVARARHPVIRGLQDFQIHDETYGGFTVSPDMTPLLTTTEPTSSKTVAWVHKYENSKVVTIQLGHDHLAYENPNFRALVNQAIRWTAPARQSR